MPLYHQYCIYIRRFTLTHMNKDISYLASLDLPWFKLQNSSVLITGATGMIGKLLIDTIMYRNIHNDMNCSIYAISRTEDTAKKRFHDYWDSPYFTYISHDINQPLYLVQGVTIEYFIHMASNTHPVAYASDPIGTVTANVIGTHLLLDSAVRHKCKRFLFTSTCEVYGENRGDVEFFEESYCGYIDCNTLRAGYPESKRCGEALCQAYKSQHQLDIVIPRLSRTYGPSMLTSDTKAISQFILKGVHDEDIILKSEGTQLFTYTHVTDSVSGILTTLLLGVNGEAYNIAHESSDIMMKDLAGLIADYTGRKVIFELPDAVERAGFSTATKSRLDGTKIQKLGWNPLYTIETGIQDTINRMKQSTLIINES